MKNKLNFIVILTVVLFVFGCSNDTSVKNKNDWAKENLHGKVQSFTELTYEALDYFGSIEKDSLLSKIQYI